MSQLGAEILHTGRYGQYKLRVKKSAHFALKIRSYGPFCTKKTAFLGTFLILFVHNEKITLEQNGCHLLIVRELNFLGNSFFNQSVQPITCQSAPKLKVFKEDVLAPFFNRPFLHEINVFNN